MSKAKRHATATTFSPPPRGEGKGEGISQLRTKSERAANGLRFSAVAILIVLACTRMLLTETLRPPWTTMGVMPAASASQPDSDPAAAAATQAAMWGGPTPASSMGMFAWILLAGLLWAIAQAISPRPIVGGVALGMIALFAAGAIISTCVASNKAAARNNAVQFLGYLVSFWLVLQLLATAAARWRQVSLVAVVTAGVCFAGYGIYQHFVENPDFVANKWPAERDKFFAEHGWQADDPPARMYDERVRSAEVKSFAINANSAAAMLIVATLAAAGWAVRKWQSPRAPLRRFFATAASLLACVLFVVLLLTRSRGGISGGLLAIGLFAGLAIGRRWAIAHWKGLAISAVCVVIAASATVIVACAAMKQPEPDSFWYRNNGAMSLLYRWQYWVGTAGVVADHPWGVGGGNFGNAYLAHELPAALEEVNDPHNFVLAAVAQYGPLGALGLVGLIGWVFWRLVKPTSEAAAFLPPPLGEARGEGNSITAKRQAGLPALVALGFGVLLAAVRAWIQWPNYGDLPVNLAIAAIGPVIVLVLLLDRDELSLPDAGDGENWVRLAIGCGLVGFLLACTIDFGMSQSAPATAFWTLAAIAVAGKVGIEKMEEPTLNPPAKFQARPDVKTPPGGLGWGVVKLIGLVFLLPCFVGWVYWPVAGNEFSMRYLASNRFEIDEEGGDEVLFLHGCNTSDSQDPAFWEGFGDWWLNQGASHYWAGEYFRKAHHLDPANPQYLLRWGESWLVPDSRFSSKERELISKECLITATRLAPNSLGILNQAGQAFSKAKMYREAADCFARAIQIDDTIRRYDVKRLFALSARARRELESLHREALAGLHSATSQPGR